MSWLTDSAAKKLPVDLTNPRLLGKYMVNDSGSMPLFNKILLNIILYFWHLEKQALWNFNLLKTLSLPRGEGGNRIFDKILFFVTDGILILKILLLDFY